jgi:hypothetical protein
MKRLQRAFHRVRVMGMVLAMAVLIVCSLAMTLNIPVPKYSWIAILLTPGLMTVCLGIRVRRLAQRLYETEFMLCPSCEYDLRGSLTAVCPKCAAVKSLSQCPPAGTCTQCESTLRIPSECKCPECGIGFDPQDVRTQWKKWVRQIPLWHQWVFKRARPRSRAG